MSQVDNSRIFRDFLAAGLGCAIADTIFNPLEVLKVRLQVFRSTNPAVSVNFLEFTSKIVKTDGIIGLWVPGLEPTILRGFFYAGYRIGCYPTMKRLTTAATGLDADSFAIKLLAGGVCGATGSLVFSPLDLARVQMQADSKKYRNTFQALFNIFKNDGIKSGLWRGATASIYRATFLSATQLSCYETFKSSITGFGYEEGPIIHAISSLASGTIAQLTVMPFDVVKTQVMTAAVNRESRGICYVSVISKIFKNDGMLGFYRGTLPAIMRQGPCILIQVN